MPVTNDEIMRAIQDLGGRLAPTMAAIDQRLCEVERWKAEHQVADAKQTAEVRADLRACTRAIDDHSRGHITQADMVQLREDCQDGTSALAIARELQLKAASWGGIIGLVASVIGTLVMDAFKSLFNK